jgi:hypothetical protein
MSEVVFDEGHYFTQIALHSLNDDSRTKLIDVSLQHRKLFESCILSYTSTTYPQLTANSSHPSSCPSSTPRPQQP